MLVLPGSGLAVLALGVGVLSLEFAWAQTLVRKIACQKRFNVALWAVAAGSLALSLVVCVAATL